MSRYGPHREDDAPTEVTVLPDGKWPDPIQVPVPTRIKAQRRQVNTLAHTGKVEPMGPALPSRAQASAARDLQMDRTAAAASPEWVDAARKALWYLATTQSNFTTDEVWAELERRGVPAPDEPRALGPVVFKALRAGVIRDTGRMARSLRRHGTKITVYERTRPDE